MRDFDYFLYENNDPCEMAPNAFNPRRLMNRATSAVLQAILDKPDSACAADALRGTFGTDEINGLLRAGFLREDGDAIAIAFPFFVHEDAGILRAYCRHYATKLADRLTRTLPACRRIAGRIDNGYPEEINLYHVLCARVFDGALFDCLSESGLVATHKRQPSGLDYILTAYEKCEALDSFSNKLLCSYNRFADAACSLQSFGDADGDRHDLYRFARRLEAGQTADSEAELRRLWRALGDDARSALLRATVSLHRTGNCAPGARRLLEAFGYADDRGICVPVYGASVRSVVEELRDTVWCAVEDELRAALTAPAMLDALACKRQGAAQEELNNELYHLLFGSVNEELVRRGIVASPAYHPGEGRYLKAMELDE